MSGTDIAGLDLDQAAEVLRALAHPVRLALLRALVDRERSVGEIEQLTGIGQPGLSQQLGILRKAALVATRREAKLVFYRISQARIAEVSALIDAYAGTVAIAREGGDATGRAGAGGAAMFAQLRAQSR